MARLGVSYWIASHSLYYTGRCGDYCAAHPLCDLQAIILPIVTFGFAELFFRIIRNEQWLVGAPNGQLRGIPSPTLFGITFNQNWHNYYHILILLTLVVFITYRLQHSRVGRAWVAIREDEQAAESMGINVSRYKSLAFAVSAAIGALGGGFNCPISGEYQCAIL